MRLALSLLVIGLVVVPLGATIDADSRRTVVLLLGLACLAAGGVALVMAMRRTSGTSATAPNLGKPSRLSLRTQLLVGGAAALVLGITSVAVGFVDGVIIVVTAVVIVGALVLHHLRRAAAAGVPKEARWERRHTRSLAADEPPADALAATLDALRDRGFLIDATGDDWIRAHKP